MMYPTKSIQFLTMCRWKYADVRREADVEGPDEVEEESNKRELSNKTISHWNEVFRLAVGQEMLSRQEMLDALYEPSRALHFLPRR